MTTYMIFTSSLGAVILLVMSYYDFQQRVLKPKRAGRYYAAFFLFSLINLTVYFGLCSFFLQIDPISAMIRPDDFAGRQFTGLQMAQPILISLMYFGTGLAKFKIGDKEVDIYQKFLDAFQSILAIQFTEAQRIRQAIQKTTTELEFLNDKIKDLHDEAERRHWDKMEDNWKDINQDIDLLNNHVDYLSSIREHLRDPISHDKISDIKENIVNRINQVRTSQISKLKRYVAEFIIRNCKNEDDIEKLLNELGAAITNDYRPKEPNYIARCVTVCALFGLLFGPIYAVTIGENVVHYSRYGAISLAIFGLVFSSVRSAKKNVTDFLMRAIISGSIAGAAGHLVWMWMTSDTVPMQFNKLVFGVEFGAALALLIYFFRVMELNLPISIKYIAIGITGGVIFMVLGFLNELHLIETLSAVQPFYIYLLLILLGLVVTWALAIGLNIFSAGSRLRSGDSQ